MAAPHIIGRPSEVEPLLERAGQRAQEVERAAAQDIEQFMSEQVAEAEATEGFASVAEAAAGAAETAAAAEAPGALALFGEAVLGTAAGMGAAVGGLAVAGAALVGTAWALHGGMVAAEHFLGWGGGGGTDTDASRPSSATSRRSTACRSSGRSSTSSRGNNGNAPGLPDRHFFTGLNPAPLASGSDSSGPRAQRAQGSRQLPAPSFEALRSASEPEAA